MQSWRRSVAAAVGKMEGVRASSAIAHALAGTHAGLGARLQGRRFVLLRFQYHLALRRVAGAGCDRIPGVRQTGVGQQEYAIHKQRRGEQMGEASSPQRLGVESLNL